MMQYLAPRWFLLVGGATLLALGVLGFILVYGVRLAENNVFYLTNGENVAHTVLGVVALILAAALPANGVLQRVVVALVGVVALFFAVYGYTVASAAMPNTFGLANLENPLDNVLHLVVGVWALVAAFVMQPARAS